MAVVAVSLISCWTGGPPKQEVPTALVVALLLLGSAWDFGHSLAAFHRRRVLPEAEGGRRLPLWEIVPAWILILCGTVGMLPSLCLVMMDLTKYAGTSTGGWGLAFGLGPFVVSLAVFLGGILILRWGR